MLTQLLLGVILAFFSLAFARDGINVTCLKDSVSITWRISADLDDYKDRFYLGSCEASKHETLSSEALELQFHYRFGDCKFKQKMSGKYAIYENELMFKPEQKGYSPAFQKIIHCITERSDIWIPPFLNPGAGSSEARGGLLFHMAILNDDLTDISKNNLIPLGSSIPIWAGVDQQFHQPLLLLMEECFVATSSKIYAESQVYPLITNKGCLMASKTGNAVFLPRHHSSSIILRIQAQFELGHEVYIHCKLVAWDPDRIGKTMKACFYSKESHSWELLDRPDKSSVCSCCDGDCNGRSKRDIETESEGVHSVFVLGPLKIVDESEQEAQDKNSESFSAV